MVTSLMVQTLPSLELTGVEMLEPVPVSQLARSVRASLKVRVMLVHEYEGRVPQLAELHSLAP